jgi:hypothetical protein
MGRWLKKVTLKRSSQEPEYFALNLSHIDNHNNKENDTNEITYDKIYMYILFFSKINIIYDTNYAM